MCIQTVGEPHGKAKEAMDYVVLARIGIKRALDETHPQ
jgi:hypothetical protein